MERLVDRRRTPFVFVGVALLAVCIVVIALPQSLLEQVERNRPLTDAQAGWAYRLLALVALAQAAYGGFAIFRVERVAAARERDVDFAALPPAPVISSLGRTAAAMVGLTLVYGIATLAITGLRGGFWLFPLIAVAQGAWYFREIGEVARWAAFQPQPPVTKRAWTARVEGHVPALARGMKRISVGDQRDAGHS